MSWPKEYGGQDLLLSYLGLLFEEAGRHLAPLPMLGTLVSALILARHGSAAQRALLPQVVAGELMLAYAVQEPNCRWPLDAVALAGWIDGGDLVLTGQKSFVDNLHTADRCLVVFRMLDGSGLLLALLDPQAPGIAVEDLVTTAGDHALRCGPRAAVRQGGHAGGRTRHCAGAYGPGRRLHHRADGRRRRGGDAPRGGVCRAAPCLRPAHRRRRRATAGAGGGLAPGAGPAGQRGGVAGQGLPTRNA